MCIPAIPPQQIDGLIQQYRTNYLARGHTQTKMYPGVAEGAGRAGRAQGHGHHQGIADHARGAGAIRPDPILRPRARHRRLPLQARAGRGAGGAGGARTRSPEDCLFVGDSPADMEAGRRAGVRTCAVRYGYGKADELAKWAPDYWVSDLRELV